MLHSSSDEESESEPRIEVTSDKREGQEAPWADERCVGATRDVVATALGALGAVIDRRSNTDTSTDTTDSDPSD